MFPNRIIWKVQAIQTIMTVNDKGRNVLTNVNEAKDFIRENWPDKIGEQILLWLDNIESELSSLERRRELVSLKKQKIYMVCTKMWDEGSDPPKELVLRRR